MTTPAAMTVSYNNLLERVGRFLFGQRSGYSDSETSDIEDCIQDGLRMVYSAHDWSFFKPVQDITTTAPYTTGTITVVNGVVTLLTGTFPSWAADGLLKASNGYYSVASRDSNSQVTLDDTTLDIAAGTTYELARPEIPMDAAFEASVRRQRPDLLPGPKRTVPAGADAPRQRDPDVAARRPVLRPPDLLLGADGGVRSHGRVQEGARVLPGAGRGIRAAGSDDTQTDDDRC